MEKYQIIYSFYKNNPRETYIVKSGPFNLAYPKTFEEGDEGSLCSKLKYEEEFGFVRGIVKQIDYLASFKNKEITNIIHIENIKPIENIEEHFKKAQEILLGPFSKNLNNLSIK